MGLGKTYSTKYLVDSNNNTGAVGEVLVSTATGINWANGSDIVGGPYLPLAGGTMTGTAGIIFPDDFKLNIGTGSDLEIYHDPGHSYITNNTGDLTIDSQGDDLILKSADDFIVYVAGTEIAIQADSDGRVALRYDNTVRFQTTSTGVEVTGKITNLTAGTGNLDAVNVQQLNDATTGALIFKGTWSAASTTTSTTSAAVSNSTIVVISSSNTGISVGATVTGAALPAGITVTAIAVDEITLTISSAQSITSGATLTFTTVGGIPDLSQTARKVTGDYYICETAGVATPNSTGTTPDDWAVGDWVAFSDLATDAWQKIDNSSVLSGAGTGGTVPVWAGSGTSVTLGDAPITVSGNNAAFAGKISSVKELINVNSADGTRSGGFEVQDDGDLFIGTATTAGNIVLTTGNTTNGLPSTGTARLTLNSTAATFTGAAYFTKPGAAAYGSINLENDDPFIRLYDNGTGSTADKKKWDIRAIGATGSEQFEIRTVNDANNVFSTKLSIAHNGDATFAGDVTATTFLGDLNGTINTATTGATQTAGDNSTLIATTAYADAAAAAGGGNFLPLSAGDSYPLTGNLVIEGNAKVLRLKRDANQSWIQYVGSNDDFIIRDETDGRTAFVAEGDGTVFFPGGNVGIGTTTTNAISGTNPTLTLGGTSISGGLILQKAGTDTARLYENASNMVHQGMSGVGHHFYVNAATQAMVIDTDGKVGIGMATPSEKLEVDGNVLVTAALLSNQENTEVDTGAETVASVLIATYTAAFFDFVIKNGTNLRAGTVFACHDGTNVVYTETSTNDLGDTSDVTLSVDILGTDMRLRATVTSDDWIIKSLIRAI